MIRADEAARLAIKHEMWDGQDPHTCVEECMEYNPCVVKAEVLIRGNIVLVRFIVEPLCAEELLREVGQPCYIFQRAMRVEARKQVDRWMKRLKRSGLECVVL